jgi:hypothetical protein
MFIRPLLLVLLAATAASGVPALQVYMPGATYDAESESWLSTDNPFTLQVLGASRHGNLSRMDDLKLHVAVPQDWWEDGTTVTISGPGYEGGVTLTDWPVGRPDEIAPHGVYPTYYNSLTLPDMNLADGTDIVHDFNPGETGEDIGVIYEYTVSYDEAFGIHLDASGLALHARNGRYQSVFSPFSHDADAPGGGNGEEPIPEPPALLLAVLALGGATLRRRT